jgi:signal transduction histidine kinase
LDEMEDVIEDIERDALRASEVISGVRAIFKTTPDNRAITRVANLARQALSLSEPDLRANLVSVETEFRDDQVHVQADTVQMQQVILNLIRNAIEAINSLAPEERRVKLTTFVEGSFVFLTVQDAGAGIPAEDRDRIFDAFYTTKNSGMGLGLAISRTIVEGHGGTLRLAGSGPKGSILEISLPIKSA